MWDTWDPTLISEVKRLLSMIEDFSLRDFLPRRTSSPPSSSFTSSPSTPTWDHFRSNSSYTFSSFPSFSIFSAECLPQVSLSLMILDICKFCCLYILVLFAFSCGRQKHLKNWSVEFMSNNLKRNFIGSFQSEKKPAFLSQRNLISSAHQDKIRYYKVFRDEPAAVVLCRPREEAMPWCEFLVDSIWNREKVGFYKITTQHNRFPSQFAEQICRALLWQSRICCLQYRAQFEQSRADCNSQFALSRRLCAIWLRLFRILQGSASPRPSSSSSSSSSSS